jgi:hypothetical protein
MPHIFAGDPFITLETQLDEAVSSLEVHLVAPIDMVPPFGGIYAIEEKCQADLLTMSDYIEEGEQTIPISQNISILGNNPPAASWDDTPLWDSLCIT